MSFFRNLFGKKKVADPINQPSFGNAARSPYKKSIPLSSGPSGGGSPSKSYDYNHTKSYDNGLDIISSAISTSYSYSDSYSSCDSSSSYSDNSYSDSYSSCDSSSSYSDSGSSSSSCD